MYLQLHGPVPETFAEGEGPLLFPISIDCVRIYALYLACGSTRPVRSNEVTVVPKASRELSFFLPVSRRQRRSLRTAAGMGDFGMGQSFI